MSENRLTRNPATLAGAAGKLALGLFLAASVAAQAQVTLTTVGGGVRAQCGPAAGFKAGNTWMAAQFNVPYASAFDTAGNLWVADMNNGDIEELTVAGDRTSSLTYEYSLNGNKHPFPNVIGVALDGGNHLYVLTTTTLLKFDDVTTSFPNLNLLFEISLSAFSSSPATAMAVVNDSATNIYISFASSSSGSIIRIPQPYSGSYSTVVNGYSFNPGGMAVRQDGQLGVTDTLHHGVYVVTTNANSVPVLVAGGLGAGFANGASGFSKFNTPHGIAASADGRMVVADTGNNLVRIVDINNNSTTLIGTLSNVWTGTCCSCNPALYAGWVDGTFGTTSSNASTRQPLSVTISSAGVVFLTDQYYSLIRTITGSGLTPAIPANNGGGSGGSTNLATVTTLAASSITTTGATLNASVVPNGSSTTIYFQYGTNSSYGSNTSSTVISTNLGGTNSVSIPLAGLISGTVIHFQAVAINNGGTSLGGDRTFITGAASSASNQIGLLNSAYAGIGSTVYLPLYIQLQSGATLTSLQFRVEVTPNGGAPGITSMDLGQVTSNDFVSLAGLAPAGGTVTYSLMHYTNTASPNGQGILFYSGPSSGMSVQSAGVTGLMTFPVPFNATVGQTYNVSVLYPSGSVSNLTGITQTITITNRPYLAGDCYPPTGYQAEEFGDGVIDNDDVNAIVSASMGLHVPPLFSDAFNAMDVMPQSTGVGGDNGDGFIFYQDWNEALLRSVGLSTTNWLRYWTNNGFLVGQPTTTAFSTTNPAFHASGLIGSGTPPGTVWVCQANILAGTLTNMLPGAMCSIPISARVHAGYSLAGFQFRAIVTPNGNAPPVGNVTFANVASIPAPLSYHGLGSNDLLNAWELNTLPHALQNSNYIGTINFQIPSNATAGQSYAVHFQGVDGANDDNSIDYAMESFPGTVWVASAALQSNSITSDEWKKHFFGDITDPSAADNVDADGDGAANWQEYLAGTDPTESGSVLQFINPTYSSTGGGLNISWLTAPGKTYILESISAVGGQSWTPVNTNLGDGNTYQFIPINNSGTAQFFRIRLQP